MTTLRRMLLIPALATACGRNGAQAVSSAPSVATTTPAPVAAPRDKRLWIDMKNVDLHIDAHRYIRIRRLRGEAVPAAPDGPAVLDDASSFNVRVTSGTVALSGDALSALLNDFVFAYKGAPLERLHVHTSGSEIVQTGIMHKGVDLPFEITATLNLEPDGRIRLHPTRTRILGVNGAKLLSALGLHLDKLLDLRGARGASVKGNDFYLEPTKILPPPGITGRLADIRIEGADVVEDFVRLPDDSVFSDYARPDSAAANYIFFRGSRLRFGKLLMTDTDLQIVDADERDPFDLYLKEYNRQLTAGTSRTMPNLGLRVIMPDYRAVAGSAPATPAPGPRVVTSRRP
ncbi:MAG: hypothetical protein ACJ79K_13770 [Gemmatimonadaceae bacterium]